MVLDTPCWPGRLQHCDFIENATFNLQHCDASVQRLPARNVAILIYAIKENPAAQSVPWLQGFLLA